MVPVALVRVVLALMIRNYDNNLTGGGAGPNDRAGQQELHPGGGIRATPAATGNGKASTYRPRPVVNGAGCIYSSS